MKSPSIPLLQRGRRGIREVTVSNRKFAADGMVGRLARWLRLAGFDTVYVNSARPSDILGLARREDRFILTRSTYLEEHEPNRVFRIKSVQVWEQLKEVVQHFHLKVDESLLLTRCSICNYPLEKKSKEEVKDTVPPYVFQTQAEFYSCSACRRIYWSGTHWEHIREIILRIQELSLRGKKINVGQTFRFAYRKQG